MIGTVLDNRYELVEFIGKGGMALVYRAIDKRTGHHVAVKILRPEYNQDAEFCSRFEREAVAASKMSHHNIVNLLDVGQDDSTFTFSIPKRDHFRIIPNMNLSVIRYRYGQRTDDDRVSHDRSQRKQEILRSVQ